jgi:hypothetical protein
MEFFRRTLYLLYYVKESDFRQLHSFLKYSSAVTGKSGMKIIFDVIRSVYEYNISLKDFFCFRFFELDDTERNKWAGSGYMYEYQLYMNPRRSREVLESKIEFLNYFRPFIRRIYNSFEEIKGNMEFAEALLGNSSGLIVLKGSRGQVGAEVEVVRCKDFSQVSLLKYMARKKYDLAEQYVIQHPSLMTLSPSGLNTLRIFTQLNEDSVDILGARLRITVNSTVDNMAAGNLAAPINIESGLVIGPGVYSDITKEEMAVHPITGRRIIGFAIPYWKEAIELAKEAALLIPDNRSVGWDIAITPEGPELIEGNHNWCKLLWQMPVKRGLKNDIDKYLQWKKS